MLSTLPSPQAKLKMAGAERACRPSSRQMGHQALDHLVRHWLPGAQNSPSEAGRGVILGLANLHGQAASWSKSWLLQQPPAVP